MNPESSSDKEEKKFPHVDKIFVPDEIAIIVPPQGTEDDDGGEELEKPPRRPQDSEEPQDRDDRPQRI